MQVAQEEWLEERTIVVIKDGKETAKTVSDLLEPIRSKVEGIVRDTPIRPS